MGTTDTYVSLVKRLFTEGFTKGKNPKVFDEVLAENLKCTDSSMPTPMTGIETFKKREANYLKAFPDKVATIDDIIASGDDVVVRWTVTGTHKGDLPGIAATGNPIRINGIHILKFSKGKVTEIYQVWDRLGLLEQLGQTQYAETLR